MKSLLILLAIIGGLYALICILMYNLQEKFIFFPEVLPEKYSFNFAGERNWEEIWLNNEEARLHGLHFKVENPKGIILYFHGNAGSLRDWGTVAADFCALGYDILVMDYRGYGKSKGKLSEMALFADAQVAYDFAKAQYGEEKTVLFGRSLGSGIAAYLAANNQPQKLILETPYISLLKLSKDLYPWLPVGTLHRYPILTDKYWSKINCPVHWVHGTGDRVIPVSHSQYLAKLAPEKNIRYTEIPGGGHNDLSMFPAYQAFLQDALQNNDR